MKFHRATVAVAALAWPVLAAQAHAAELNVMCTTSFRTVVEELGPRFEKATENKLVSSFGPTALLKAQIDQGAGFDVAILTAPMIDGLANTGKIDAATRVTIARAGLGVSVRAGAAKPDVSTDEALKRTLSNAKSIGYNGQGASRAGTEAMLAKLGIADEIKPKIKLLDKPAPEAVANGEVEVGLGPVSEILPVAGAEVAGSYPADVQSYLVLTAAVSSASKNADTAKALIKFLTTPDAAAVLKAKGIEPG